MKKFILGIGSLVLSCFYTSLFAQGVFFNMILNYTPSPGACSYFINSGALYMAVNPMLPDTITGGERTQSLVNPGYTNNFPADANLGYGVNPTPRDQLSGGENIRALVNNNYTISVLNARPGYTVLVPALNEQVFCSAMCAFVAANCWQQCRFAVSNFYSVQHPTYAVPNGTVNIICPTLNMGKYPNYPSDPWTKFPYTH